MYVIEILKGLIQETIIVLGLNQATMSLVGTNGKMIPSCNLDISYMTLRLFLGFTIVSHGYPRTQ